MKYLNKFELFVEALKPSVAKRYVKHFNRERYDKLFKSYKEKYEGDRNAYRIFLPLISQPEKKVSILERDITDFLNEFGYDVINYIDGVCKFKGAKNPSKIGQVLTKISAQSKKDGKLEKSEDADIYMKSFVEDPIRKVGAESDLLVCISRHPYDIAGADTDRNWTDCMTLPHTRGNEDNVLKLRRLKNEQQQLEVELYEISNLMGKKGRTEGLKYLGVSEDEYDQKRKREESLRIEINLLEEENERTEAGCNTHYLICDVKEGSLISYLIKKSDKNIQNPLGCLNIKPYIDSSDPENVILVSDKESYGDRTIPEFKKTVDAWLDEINKGKEGFFNMNPLLYDDSSYGTIFRMDINKVQNKVDACKNLSDLSKLLNSLRRNKEYLKVLELKPDNILKLVDSSSVDDLYSVQDDLKLLLGRSRKYSWKSLMKYKLNKCDTSDISYDTYRKLISKEKEFIEILSSPKFNKIRLLIELNRASQRHSVDSFLDVFNRNEDAKDLINFVDLFKNKSFFV
jgi:hypothetical protein